MTTKERLLEFLSFLQIGQTKFEEQVGLSRGLINNMKGSLSTASTLKISKRYPELDTDWLLTGEGKMLKDAPAKEEKATPQSDISKLIEIIASQQETIRLQAQMIANLQGGQPINAKLADTSISA